MILSDFLKLSFMNYVMMISNEIIPLAYNFDKVRIVSIDSLKNNYVFVLNFSIRLYDKKLIYSCRILSNFFYYIQNVISKYFCNKFILIFYFDFAKFLSKFAFIIKMI